VYCDSAPHGRKLSLDKFEAIKTKLLEGSGQFFLKEVVDAFIEMIHQEILESADAIRNGQILIFADDPDLAPPVELRLSNEGFRSVTESDFDAVGALYQRSQPDALILVAGADTAKIHAMIDGLKEVGFDLDAVQTFLLIRGTLTSSLSDIINKGVEDVLALDGNIDLLIYRLENYLTKLHQPPNSLDERKASPGVSGALSDMSLIDIMQAVGPGQKTAKIFVNLAGLKRKQLELYLDKGRIIYAKCGEKIGAEAVYEAIQWVDGQWKIETINPDNLPEPNNDATNESILMEGCRRLDEKTRSASTSAPQTT
jgi:DNA-binding response OmpR family regulator